jgi:hypothetical protein
MERSRAARVFAHGFSSPANPTTTPMKPTSHPHPLRRLAALLVAALLLPAAAFADGSIAGTLKHATHGSPLQGASVRLTPGDREAVTDRAGAYFLGSVPAGNYTLEISYLGLEPKSIPVRVTDGQIVRADSQLADSGVVVLAAVNVESVREGQARAINQQRTSTRISNIISSDAIGNLPDRTVGEALARLPGVNVVDDQFANVRGTPAEFNAVTLDGDRLSTAGPSVDSTSVNTDTRAVDLSLIPAEMVGGIEVIKTLTPDMDADSFGGTINLVSRSAFDLTERSITGSSNTSTTPSASSPATPARSRSWTCSTRSAPSASAPRSPGAARIG